MQRKRIGKLSFFFSSLLLSGLSFAQGGTLDPQLSVVPKEIPEVVLRSVHLGRVNGKMPLHLTLSLPFRDQGAAEAYAEAVNDPKSPFYRKYLTPEEVGTRFGLGQPEVDKVTKYLTSQGIHVSLVGKNHLSIGADCTVGEAEAAFHTELHNFQTLDPREPGQTSFYSFTSPLALPKELGRFVSNVSGLENFTKPRAKAAMTAAQARVFYNSAGIYNSGSTGLGRTIGISNFDGYRLTNIPLYYTQNGLPTPSGGVGHNITVIPVGTPAGPGTPSSEGDLDIQMVLGMAPLCTLRIYDSASDLIGVLTAEVNDNLCDVITESYGWNLSAADATSAHNLHVSMSNQGITYMAASGDNGTALEPYAYPDYDPEVLMVGGTVNTFSAAGARTAETAWNGSGGGYSINTATFNVLPSWQKGKGVPTTLNKRLVPDLALEAGNSPGAYFFYLNGTLTSSWVGTSFACPVFAGTLGIAEQSIIAQGGLPADAKGKRRFGRIQNLIYSQNGRSDVWYDITSGSNGTLPNGTASVCTAGWDTVTGWGDINVAGFISAIVTTTKPPVPTGLKALPANGYATLSWNASNGATLYHLKRSATLTGTYTTVLSPTSSPVNNVGLVNGTTYYYEISAVNSIGESANSAPVSVTPVLAKPAAPAGVKATPGNAKVVLTWAATYSATTYNVKRSTLATGPFTAIVGSPTTATFTDTTVTNGTRYYYVITAVNTAGESLPSVVVSAIPTANPLMQLLLNPGFELGDIDWVASSGVIGNTTGEVPHSGSMFAWLDGYGAAHTDILYQQVTIPATVNTATLSFWLHIDTAEPGTVATDKLFVQVRNSSGTVIGTLATYSNLNANVGYQQVAFNMLPYKGQTIQVYLIGTEDAQNQTSFVVDDFLFNVQ